MYLVKLIKICLNENYSKVRIGKYLPDVFLFKLLESRNCNHAIALQL